jgi:DNA ligase (NAD+)
MSKKISHLDNTIKNILHDPYTWANNASINELVEILKTLSFHYYNTGNELVSDQVYDILQSVLQERDSTNPFLSEIGAPITKNKVKLPYHMPSLDKIKPNTGSLANWKKKHTGPYVVSDKLDGVSALLVRNGKNFKLYTRGDGSEGQDITHLIPYVIPNFRKLKVPDGGAIRGELIISKKNFKEISVEFKNGRNAVAGLVNSKNFSEKVAKLTEFISYAIINPRMKQEEQMKLLVDDWKLVVVTYAIFTSLTEDKLSSLLEKRRKEAEYEMDGLVVIDSSKVYDVTKANPEHGFAYKQILLDQIAETSVIDVEWTVSMHGFLKPRIKVEPVDIGGATIQYATAFNAKFIVDNNLGPGAIVKLIRSGDVIPYIMEVLKASKTGKPKFPDIPYKWNKSNVDFLVKDIHGDAKDNIRTKQITHFMKEMNVKYISEGIVTKLVDNGYDSIQKIVKAKPEQLEKIEGLGETIVTKIIENLTESFKISTLSQLMAASTQFGRGLGTKKLKIITKAYPNIMNDKFTKKELKEKIMLLEGFDDITADQFVDHFDEFKKFFDELEKIAPIAHLRQPSKINKNIGNLSGKKIVFTGFRDKALEEKIEKEGGQNSGSVSKNTNIVIYADTTGAKYKKAVELGITVMTPDEFKNTYFK